MSPNTPVIIDAVRTPLGRAHPDKGCYRQVSSLELGTRVVQGLLVRTGIPPETIEDLLCGCAQQSGEQGGNLGRVLALAAGLPFSVAGATVNRWCGSSLEALAQAAWAIRAGDKQAQIVAGVEHMHHCPVEGNWDIPPELLQVTSRAALHMGLTAEFLAASRNISRNAQDEYALQSHLRGAAAYQAGHFAAELVAVPGHDAAGNALQIDRDQGVRAQTSLDQLAALPPAFQPTGGTVTAGNSSPRSDGAAALLVMSLAQARELGLRPLAAIMAASVVGVPPALMGTGPVPAVEKLLQRTGLALADFDHIELNEAFAAQALACIADLRLPVEKTNPLGGAIALGHPLGASGARIVTSLVHALHRTDGRYGLATMCIGLGQGIALAVERMD
ncbi:MAG: thiolase family protein [Pirellulales bacterium]|nr:thiolase family protein [Pirellulales bacterium]